MILGCAKIFIGSSDVLLFIYMIFVILDPGNGPH